MAVPPTTRRTNRLQRADNVRVRRPEVRGEVLQWPPPVNGTPGDTHGTPGDTQGPSGEEPTPSAVDLSIPPWTPDVALSPAGPFPIAPPKGERGEEDVREPDVDDLSCVSLDAEGGMPALDVPTEERPGARDVMIGPAREGRGWAVAEAGAHREAVTLRGVVVVLLAALAVGEGVLLLRTTRAVPRSEAVPARAAANQRLGRAGTSGTAAPANAALSQTAPKSGRLSVATQPAGAGVVVDGKPRGAAPVSVGELSPGNHEVIVRTRHGELRQQVHVTAGESLSVVVPLAAVQPPAALAATAAGGATLAVRAPVELRVFDGEALVGTSAMPRINLRPGSHRLTLRNDDLGFQQARTVSLPGGKTTTLNVALPKQKLAVNAVPWAEVTLDQQRVGETPLGAVDVTVGPHVMVFHHPDLGDKTVRVMVRADEAARVSVDMRR